MSRHRVPSPPRNRSRVIDGDLAWGIAGGLLGALLLAAFILLA
ncbi:hypothetical protein ACFYVR_22230 [Rhodococcus sp. NPDC003318]